MVRARTAPGGQRNAEPTLRVLNPATLVSRYGQFSWRDWFSGQGDRYDLADQQHAPIRATHISDPYVSSLLRFRPVREHFRADSAPRRQGRQAGRRARSGDPAAGDEPLAARGQHRPRRIHRRLRPALTLRPAQRCALSAPAGEPAKRYFSPEKRGGMFPDQFGTLPDYHDPIDGQRYLVGYARMADADLGWLVLVQHQRQQILAPLEQLRQAPRLGRLAVVRLVGRPRPVPLGRPRVDAPPLRPPRRLTACRVLQ